MGAFQFKAYLKEKKSSAGWIPQILADDKNQVLEQTVKQLLKYFLILIQNMLQIWICFFEPVREFGNKI